MAGNKRTAKNHPEMIANIKKGTGFGGITRYHQVKIEQGKAELIGATGGLTGKDLKGIAEKFDMDVSRYRRLHAGSKGRKLDTVTFHPSVNFAPGEHIANETMMDIARDYMNGMSYGNNDYAVIRHNDKPHEHFHIVACRIDNDFRLVSDSLEKVKSRELSRKLERKYGLKNAETKSRKQGQSQSANFNYNAREHVNERVQEAARRIGRLAKVNIDRESLLNAFVNILKQDRITVEESKGGLCYLSEKDGKRIRFKASELPGKFTKEKLTKIIEGQPYNTSPTPDVKDNLRRSLFAILKASRDYKSFEANCNKQGITIKLAENKRGVYGIHFTKNGTDFKGSDLARGLTWTGISAALKGNTQRPETVTRKVPEQSSGMSGQIRSAWQGIARNMDGNEDDEEERRRKNKEAEFTK